MNRYTGSIKFEGLEVEDVDSAISLAKSRILDGVLTGNSEDNNSCFSFCIQDNSKVATALSLKDIDESVFTNAKLLINSYMLDDVVDRIYVSECGDSDCSDELVLRFELIDNAKEEDLIAIIEEELGLNYEPVPFLSDVRELLILAEFYEG